MADPDPNTPQVVDPERVVDLTRLLQIRGPLGVLNVLDTIVPVVNMGDVVPRTVRVEAPSFRSTDVFSNGPQTNQVINTILADTGALAAGIYDLSWWAGAADTDTDAFIAMEHRNAANTANLAIWNTLAHVETGNFVPPLLGYELAINERLRLRQGIAGSLNHPFNGVIFARIR